MVTFQVREKQNFQEIFIWEGGTGLQARPHNRLRWPPVCPEIKGKVGGFMGTERSLHIGGAGKLDWQQLPCRPGLAVIVPRTVAKKGPQPWR